MKNLNKTTGIILISLCFVSIVSTDLIVHAQSSDEKAKMNHKQQQDLEPIFSENTWSLTSEQSSAAQDSYWQFKKERSGDNVSSKTTTISGKLVLPEDPFKIQPRDVTRDVSGERGKIK